MKDHREARFAIEYCVDYNATQAVLRMKLTENADSARVMGCRLLATVNAQEKIKERQRQLAAAAELTPEWVLERWMELAQADPNDLSQVRRVNCRHCHGFGFNYQWTEIEYRQKLDASVEKGKSAPDASGGFGFKLNDKPNPKCPECDGQGEEKVHVADTRKVTGYGRKLFAGVKKTKDGIEVKTRDQDAALANLARYLGMNLERKEITGAGGGPIAVANLKPDDLTDEQLASVIGANDE